MKNKSKLSLDMLEVESFVSPSAVELAEVKGGTSPVVASSVPCAALVVDTAAVVVGAVATYIAATSNSNPPATSTPSGGQPTSVTTYGADSTRVNSDGSFTTYGADSTVFVF